MHTRKCIYYLLPALYPQNLYLPTIWCIIILFKIGIYIVILQNERSEIPTLNFTRLQLRGFIRFFRVHDRGWCYFSHLIRSNRLLQIQLDYCVAVSWHPYRTSEYIQNVTNPKDKCSTFCFIKFFHFFFITNTIHFFYEKNNYQTIFIYLIF